MNARRGLERDVEERGRAKRGMGPGRRMTARVIIIGQSSEESLRQTHMARTRRRTMTEIKKKSTEFESRRARTIGGEDTVIMIEGRSPKVKDEAEEWRAGTIENGSGRGT